MIGRKFRVGQLWKNSRGSFMTVISVNDDIAVLRKGKSLSRGRKHYMGAEAPDKWTFVAPLAEA